MKNRKLLFSSLLLLGGLTTQLFFSSTNSAMSGVMGAYSTGCGNAGCHGSAGTGNTVTITGIPTSGYVAGTTYNLTLTVSNPDSLLTHGGFDMKVNGGTLSAAPANTMLMGGTELHHTNKKAVSGGNVSWSFSWTAPSANSVTVPIAVNMVNGDQNNTGDKWSTHTLTFNQAPSSVSESLVNSIDVYPNPVQTELTISQINQVKQIVAVDMLGRSSNLNFSTQGNNTRVSVQTLSSGKYVLFIQGQDVTHKVHIVKM